MNTFGKVNAALITSLAATFGALCPVTSSAAPLNPNSFTTVGDGDFDPASDVTIDTSTLSMTGGETATGVDDGGIAVFTFDSFNLDAARTITASGSRPLALLSKGTMIVAGNIDVAASGVTGGPGGGSGGSPGNSGSGSGAGTANDGAGFGGAGGVAGGFFGGAGSTYGNLTTQLQGGSGGGGRSGGGSGGGGGGGLELGSTGTLTLSGNIDASGANAGSGAGGGSGGGVFVHGNSAGDLDFSGTIDASGGNGGTGSTSGGGGGGGGRIVLWYVNTNTGSLNVLRGSGGSVTNTFVGTPGGNGFNGQSSTDTLPVELDAFSVE